MARAFNAALIILMAALLASCGPAEPPESPEEAAGSESGAEDIFTDTKNPEEVFRRGLALYQSGRFNESARAFLQATRMREAFVDAYFYAGKSILKSFPADYPKSERAFLKAIELAPNHLDAHIALAQGYHYWGRNADAAALLADARKLSPGHRGVLYSSGMVASRLGRHEEALVHLEAALARDPRHLPSMLEYAQALSHLGRDEEALEAYMNVVTAMPRNAQALMGAGTSLKRLGRDEEARQMLIRFKRAQGREEDREMHGKKVEVRLREVQEAYQSGDRRAIAAAVDRFLGEFPDGISAQMDLATLQAQLKDLEGARRVLESVLSLQPKNLSATYRLSEVYRRLGHEEMAKQLKERHSELKREQRAGRSR